MAKKHRRTALATLSTLHLGDASAWGALTLAAEGRGDLVVMELGCDLVVLGTGSDLAVRGTGGDLAVLGKGGETAESSRMFSYEFSLSVRLLPLRYQ